MGKGSLFAVEPNSNVLQTNRSICAAVRRPESRELSSSADGCLRGSYRGEISRRRSNWPPIGGDAEAPDRPAVGPSEPKVPGGLGDEGVQVGSEENALLLVRVGA